jgi:2-oxo-4-hydroxy-4-carboxy-5-ureidoimidazoline decarboxylase
MLETVRTIEEVNHLDEAGFVAAFGHVYEATPALAAAAFSARPYADREALVAAFRTAADALDPEGALALLRAHPPLAAAGRLTAESRQEQQAAGLRDVDAATQARIAEGNAAYEARFGIPFIIAVRGLGPAEVVAALEGRLTHEGDEERATALAQVQRIAALRIAQVVQG